MTDRARQDLLRILVRAQVAQESMDLAAQDRLAWSLLLAADRLGWSERRRERLRWEAYGTLLPWLDLTAELQAHLQDWRDRNELDWPVDSPAFLKNAAKHMAPLPDDDLGATLQLLPMVMACMAGADGDGSAEFDAAQWGVKEAVRLHQPFALEAVT